MPKHQEPTATRPIVASTCMYVSVDCNEGENTLADRENTHNIPPNARTNLSFFPIPMLINPLIQMRKTMLIFNRRKNNATGIGVPNKRKGAQQSRASIGLAAFFVAHMVTFNGGLCGRVARLAGAPFPRYSNPAQPATLLEWGGWFSTLKGVNHV